MLWILSHLNLLVHKRPQLNPYYSLKINSSRAIGIHTSSLARIQTFRRCMSTSQSVWRSQTDHVATTLKWSSSMVADVPVTVSAPGGAFSSHLWTISKQLLLNSHPGVRARWKKHPRIPLNIIQRRWSMMITCLWCWILAINSCAWSMINDVRNSLGLSTTTVIHCWYYTLGSAPHSLASHFGTLRE